MGRRKKNKQYGKAAENAYVADLGRVAYFGYTGSAKLKTRIRPDQTSFWSSPQHPSNVQDVTVPAADWSRIGEELAAGP